MNLILSKFYLLCNYCCILNNGSTPPHCPNIANSMASPTNPLYLSPFAVGFSLTCIYFFWMVYLLSALHWFSLYTVVLEKSSKYIIIFKNYCKIHAFNKFTGKVALDCKKKPEVYYHFILFCWFTILRFKGLCLLTSESSLSSINACRWMWPSHLREPLFTWPSWIYCCLKLIINIYLQFSDWILIFMFHFIFSIVLVISLGCIN